jgi:hypothetical protein
MVANKLKNFSSSQDFQIAESDLGIFPAALRVWVISRAVSSGIKTSLEIVLPWRLSFARHSRRLFNPSALTLFGLRIKWRVSPMTTVGWALLRFACYSLSARVNITSFCDTPAK